MQISTINLFDGLMETGSLDYATGNNDNTSDSAVSRTRSINYIPVKAGTTYTLSGNGTSGYGIRLYDADKNITKSLSVLGTSISTFTTTENTVYMRFTSLTSQFANYMLNTGITSADYEPYYEPIQISVYTTEMTALPIIWY